MNNNLSSFFNEINEVKKLTVFNDIIRKKNLGVRPREIPTTVLKIPEDVIAARALALCDIRDLEEDLKIKWQHYWLKCCLSVKYDYQFTLLSSEKIGVDREDDLKKILEMGEIWENSTEEAKRYYLSLCIDFFLKRYNLLGALKIWLSNSPKESINLLKIILLPRLLSATLVGFVPIATSEGIQTFAYNLSSNHSVNLVQNVTSEGIQTFAHNLSSNHSVNLVQNATSGEIQTFASNPLLSFFYIIPIALFFISFTYLYFECNKAVRQTVVEKRYCIGIKKRWWFRIIPVIVWGLMLSLSISFALTWSKFLGNVDLNNPTFIYIVIFNALFAFLIGILLQLLWEEKTVTEPF